MSVNVKVTGGLNIEWGQIDPKATGGLRQTIRCVTPPHWLERVHNHHESEGPENLFISRLFSQTFGGLSGSLKSCDKPTAVFHPSGRRRSSTHRRSAVVERLTPLCPTQSPLRRTERASCWICQLLYLLVFWGGNHILTESPRSSSWCPCYSAQSRFCSIESYCRPLRPNKQTVHNVLHPRWFVFLSLCVFKIRLSRI